MTLPDVRLKLIQLVHNIKREKARNPRSDALFNEFEALLPGTDIQNLCSSDYDDETIVDVCIGTDKARRHLSREEMLALVQQLSTGDGLLTEAESILAVMTFKHNCLHPAGSDLIFFPDDHFDGKSDPTPAEIVSLALRDMP